MFSWVTTASVRRPNALGNAIAVINPPQVPSLSRRGGRRNNYGRPRYEMTIEPEIINFEEKFNLFDEPWTPKVIAEINDYQFKVVKTKL